MGHILPEKVDCSLNVIQIFIHSELVNLFCSLQMGEIRFALYQTHSASIKKEIKVISMKCWASP